LFAQPHWRRDTYRELLGWTKGPDDAYFYLPLAPILYCDYENQHDVNKIFLNPALFDVSIYFV
jgi:hypothetical protein